MNLQTLEPSKYTARDKYLEYLKAEKQSHDKRIGYIKNAYRELSRGATVVDILQVLRAGGLDFHGRPKLAVCKATAKWCGLNRTWDNGQTVVQFVADKTSSRYKDDRVQVPAAIFPATLTDRQARAIVPSVPPQHTPANGLKDLFILWEADWQAVPTDPALLKHLGGPFYSVLATWDLTAVERAALEFAVRS